MTDLEITRLCAAAMGWEFTDGPAHGTVWSAARYIKDGRVVEYEYAYDPLHNDAQVMALARKFPLVFEKSVIGWCNHVRRNEAFDVNHYFCERIAKGDR